MSTKPLHTHYENLKVTRKAPIEVIRASYKAMAQKYHPDLNGGNAESLRIMTLLNLSYEVLSDPAKRTEHDAWIAQQEASPAQTVQMPKPRPSPQRSPNPPPVYEPSPIPQSTVNTSSNTIKLLRHLFNYRVIYICLGIWAWYASTEHTPSGSTAVNTAPLPQKTNYNKPTYVKPTASPLGHLWPQSASYVKGYKVLAQPGLSTVTIDNSSNDNDVFVKLMSLDFGAPMPTRHFFIPSNSQFTLKNVMAGNYDIRYKDLDSGQLARSESFILEETPSSNGTTYSNLRMTLYKVRNGNMQTYGIAEADFGD
jgi:DnaJ domain